MFDAPIKRTFKKFNLVEVDATKLNKAKKKGKIARKIKIMKEVVHLYSCNKVPITKCRIRNINDNGIKDK